MHLALEMYPDHVGRFGLILLDPGLILIRSFNERLNRLCRAFDLKGNCPL